MYKLLLSWRYLRARYIALASIISVTLGVATMIVVNSVMSGFTHEMHQRLHAILSDVVIESYETAGMPDPEGHMEEIRRVVGDDLDNLTAVVHVPAMVNIPLMNGRAVTRAINLVGVDEETYAQVCEFGPHVLHPENRQRLNFELRNGGYAPEKADFPPSGWPHRQARVQMERELEQHARALSQRAAETRGEARDPRAEEPLADESEDGVPDPVQADATTESPVESPDTGSSHSENEFQNELQTDSARLSPPNPSQDPGAVEDADESPYRAYLDELPAPSDELPLRLDERGSPRTGGEAPAAVESPDEPAVKQNEDLSADPFLLGQPQHPMHVFDPAAEQHTGVILGISICSARHRDAKGQIRDHYYGRPGDDVQITFPSASRKPEAVYDWFTIVDLYESKMSEYDSTFAFVPLRKLQEMRGMLDPATGLTSVSSIQLKLKPGADLNAVRDKLRDRFPPHEFPYVVQTWRDMQGPLLAAVRLETTILNILLFLIIAVAGFGILATFFMIVVEKTKDIGVLKALGAPSRGVMSIFLSYGFSLGVVGSGVGMVFGLLFVAYINQIAFGLEWISGQEVFDPTVYYFEEIPVIVEPFTVAWVVGGAVLIAVLASVLPALRAARMHPVEALRYE